MQFMVTYQILLVQREVGLNAMFGYIPNFICAMRIGGDMETYTLLK